MSDFALVSDAPLVAPVKTGTLDTYDTATTYAVTIGGRSVGVLGQGGTTSTTATALRTALNASTYPEFAEITWSGATNAIIATCDTTGKSIVLALSVSGGAGTVTDFSSTTAVSGPEALVAGNVKNVSTGARALPGNGDTLTVESLDVNLKYELDALSAVTLASLAIEASFTGQAALPPLNEDAATAYDEFRPQYLKAPADAVTIGAGEGDGSALILHDASNVQTAWLVVATATDGALDGLAPVILKGTHASNTLRVESGSVDVAPFAGETATILTLTAVGDALVRTGPGVTLGTVIAGGSATVDITQGSALTDTTAIHVYDSATVIIRGSNAHAAITAYGSSATIVNLGSGTITALTLNDGPTFDNSQNANASTVTTLTGSGTPTIKDPNSRLTVTNAIAPSGSNVFAWTWELKAGRAITLAAP